MVSRARIRATRQPRLVITGGRAQGQVVALRPGELLIGRAAASGLVLAEPGVSRTHAGVRCAPEGTWVTDLGTLAGTTVNGRRIHGPTRLAAGDELCLGGEARLVYLEPPPHRRGLSWAARRRAASDG